MLPEGPKSIARWGASGGNVTHSPRVAEVAYRNLCACQPNICWRHSDSIKFDATPQLSDEDIQHLIGYARGKFEEERYPFAPALRPVRTVLEKVDPKPNQEPPPGKKPYVPF